MSEIRLLAPVAGHAISIGEVADPVFCSGKMGPGFGVVPAGEGIVNVIAPVAGKVVMVAKTGHAVGIMTEDHAQVLVHMGIDTVELKGEPFDVKVAKKQQVQAGEVIATMDLVKVADAKLDPTVVVIVADAKDKTPLNVTDAQVKAGDEVVSYAPAQEESAVDKAGATGAAGTTALSAQPSKKLSKQEKYDALAKAIIAGVGGKENIRSLTHCITRERFYLKDESKADDKGIAGLDGVIEVMRAGGQYQVVIGPEVEDVYDALIKQLGGEYAGGEVPADDAGDEKPKPTTAWGWVKHGFSELIGIITASMIPVIGLMAAAGIIKGILSLLLTFDVISKETNTFQIITAMSDAVFFFLPIFVGFTAARRLGANQVTVAIIGGVLCYPALATMSENEASVHFLGMGFNSDFFGIPLSMPSYTYSIFPIIAAAWLASIVEPWLKSWIPVTLRMILLPLLEVIIVSLAILLVLGPVIMFLSTGIADGIQALYDLSPTISGALIGAFYQSLVIFGLHWAVIPLVAQQIAQTGQSPLNAIISATMVAQGGGVLAVYFKTKQEQMKGLAAPAAISAFCGITEPAMYGINLKYGRIFIMSSVGGAVGGLLTGLFKVNMWGFTGSLVGFTSFINPDGLDFSFWGFLIASAAALVIAFTMTWFFGYTDNDLETSHEVKKVRLGSREPKVAA